MFRQLFFALVATVFFVTGAQAALVTNINGAVSVNRGDGFKRVSAPTEVKPGDRVMVGEGGTADIAYDATCFTRIEPEHVVIVRDGVPCTQEAAETGEAAAGGGISTTTLVVGGLVVAGGVGLAVALSGGGSASP